MSDVPLPPALERHYSPKEIAEMWGLSPDAVRRLLEHEPGVLIIRSETTGYGKRRYRTFRVPQSVLERVHRRLANRGKIAAEC